MKTRNNVCTQRLRPAVTLLIAWCGITLVHAAAQDVPIAPGTTFVIAVSNSPDTQPTKVGENIAQGDYETVVTITAVNAEGITHTAFIDGVDESGVRRQASIARQVRSADLTDSHLQVFGFHSADPPVIGGTTSLGPSLAVTRELQTAGTVEYAFRNFASRDDITGTLTREGAGTVKFPVLINGQRVELDAIRATGKMSSGSTLRPFEQYILAHPQYPISLRIAYGPRGGDFPFKADFAREIVRIDFPTIQSASLAQALAQNCRVEVPGIYFDFNEATLKPLSKQALERIAAVLQKQPQLHVSIEGHTDNIGSDEYNDDLSTRRAAAVKTALVQDFRINEASIATKGMGEHRPVETNDTLAGRARNRRVELVRECPAKK